MVGARLRDKQFRESALSSFEGATEFPLLLLALLMVPDLLIPAVVKLDPSVVAVFDDVGWFVWACFAIEYVVRISLTSRRWHFVKRNLPDLFIIILPFLRPLRIVRSARALRLLRLVRLAAVFGGINVHLKRLLTRHNLHYALALIAAVIVICAALEANVEGPAGGNIKSFGDGLWWAMATITTVGYGDKYPITAVGRGIAVFLMFAGIALFGYLTANIASLMVASDEKANNTGEPTMSELMAKIEQLTVEVASLRASPEPDIELRSPELDPL